MGRACRRRSADIGEIRHGAEVISAALAATFRD
jgi:hypothetical protein